MGGSGSGALGEFNLPCFFLYPDLRRAQPHSIHTRCSSPDLLDQASIAALCALHGCSEPTPTASPAAVNVRACTTRWQVPTPDVRRISRRGVVDRCGRDAHIVHLASAGGAGPLAVSSSETPDRLGDGAGNALLKAVEEPSTFNGVPAGRPVGGSQRHFRSPCGRAACSSAVTPSVDAISQVPEPKRRAARGQATWAAWSRRPRRECATAGDRRAALEPTQRAHSECARRGRSVAGVAARRSCGTAVRARALTDDPQRSRNRGHCARARCRCHRQGARPLLCSATGASKTLATQKSAPDACRANA